MPIATATPAATLLDGADHTLMLIDFQSQMAFATRSIDVVELRNNAALIAEAARTFAVPAIVTTVAEKSFSGPTFDEVTGVLADRAPIDRTTMNAWEDAAVVAEVNRLGKGRVVFAGLWTSVCIVGPVLSALAQGFEAYVITDACGDVSAEAHERAVQRMVQAGARPLTALQYLLELQRDWARAATYDATVATAVAHGGGYGVGLVYARTMFQAQEGH
ncbi:hydrolase [Dokdonella koreensis]|uniref:Isochorismatase hydrolase n=1 Tax=Dokdonella koreensis DS-123 TaxID=1300342 RepID=A0A160DY97_9GAMM|nr:hydrolase [Dokdonella koreensis]ANB19574.1 Isochorismatase hydrolase [Dokdonella koreensis DS-123]